MSSSQAPIWELPDRERPVEGLDAHGAPDPAYAAALGLVSAPLGRRAAAAAIDIGVFVLLQLPLVVWALPLFRRLLSGRITWYGFVNHPDFLVSVVVAAVTLLLTLALLVSQLWMQGRWGFTLGKLATGLRAVNVATLDRPGFWRTTWRAVLAWAPVVTVVGTLLVLASPLWSRHDRLRGWHDRAGRTWLVDVRHGMNPFDKKRMRIARKTVTASPAPRIKRLPSLATGSHPALSSYRPGARTSAGVLGAARPHAPDRRAPVGLTGLEPGEPAPVPAGSTGPRLGAYVGAHPEPAATTGPVRLSPFAPVPAPARAASAPASGLAILLDDGQRIDLPGAVVIGRSPAAVDGAAPLAIVDPDFSISKTHVVLRPAGDGLHVIDQGSTNGTTLVHDGREHLLAAGEVGVAVVGDTVRFGDRTARVLGS